MTTLTTHVGLSEESIIRFIRQNPEHALVVAMRDEGLVEIDHEVVLGDEFYRDALAAFLAAETPISLPDVAFISVTGSNYRKACQVKLWTDTEIVWCHPDENFSMFVPGDNTTGLTFRFNGTKLIVTDGRFVAELAPFSDRLANGGKFLDNLKQSRTDFRKKAARGACRGFIVEGGAL